MPTVTLIANNIFCTAYRAMRITYYNNTTVLPCHPTCLRRAGLGICISSANSTCQARHSTSLTNGKRSQMKSIDKSKTHLEWQAERTNYSVVTECLVECLDPRFGQSFEVLSVAPDNAKGRHTTQMTSSKVETNAHIDTFCAT